MPQAQSLGSFPHQKPKDFTGKLWKNKGLVVQLRVSNCEFVGLRTAGGENMFQGIWNTWEPQNLNRNLEGSAFCHKYSWNLWWYLLYLSSPIKILIFWKVSNMLFFQGDPRENGWLRTSLWRHVPGPSESTPIYSSIHRINMPRRYIKVHSVSKMTATKFYWYPHGFGFLKALMKTRLGILHHLGIPKDIPGYEAYWVLYSF